MTPTKLNILVVGIVLVLTSAFGLGLLMPGLTRLKARRAEIDEKVQKVRDAQKQVGNISDVYKTIQEINRKLEDYRERLPPDRELGDYFNRLRATFSRLDISNYRVESGQPVYIDEKSLPGPLKIAAGTTILPVQISFQSNFPRLFEFLSSIESMPRLTHVEEIHLNGLESDMGLVEVQITLHTYSHNDLPTADNEADEAK